MDTELRAARESHLHRWLGGNYDILQEKESDAIRLDVYVFDVEPERPYLTLVTSGMSDLPMTMPPGLERFARAELVLNLPSPWPGLGLIREGELPQELADDRHYWPIRLVKELARHPHDRGNWLGMGHSIENAGPGTGPAEPFPGTGFTGSLVGPLLTLPPGLARLDTPDGPVLYYGIFPVTPAELTLATRDPDGPRELFELFDQRGISDVVDVGRASAVEPG
ncbi:suppressor of fused domain protein [Nakamurella lactea]|uniref:suppressor of fused domain protein n=1 Tax=Nakamurella lactea TaxID=459515 RepID=UPI000425E21A|nr:suppressor of fused domain protein [Nakamurella lactea]